MSQLYLNKILSITKLQTCGSGLLLKLQRHTLRSISVFYYLHIYIYLRRLTFTFILDILSYDISTHPHKSKLAELIIAWPRTTRSGLFEPVCMSSHLNPFHYEDPSAKLT